MATTNKNTMLPTYQGNYKDMIGALRAGDIANPCWFWVEDKNSLSFIHWEKQEDGTKKLVPHIILLDRVEKLEESVGDISTALPEGETVAEYITNAKEETVQINNQLNNVTDAITIITSKDLNKEVDD